MMYPRKASGRSDSIATSNPTETKESNIARASIFLRRRFRKAKIMSYVRRASELQSSGVPEHWSSPEHWSGPAPTPAPEPAPEPADVPAPARTPTPTPVVLIPDSPTTVMHLRRVAGETPTEVVFWRGFKNYDFYVKHEYPEARAWEWIITESKQPIDFDEASSFASAELALEAAARANVPGFDEEPRASDDEVSSHADDEKMEKMVSAGGLARQLSVGALHWTRERLGQLERWIDR